MASNNGRSVFYQLGEDAAHALGWRVGVLGRNRQQFRRHRSSVSGARVHVTERATTVNCKVHLVFHLHCVVLLRVVLSG